MTSVVHPPANGGLTPFDRIVYRRICRYDFFSKGESWPSQQLIATELGCHRSKVCRSIGRLIRAGWLLITDRVWSPRSGWLHNKYALLEPYAVSDLAAKAIAARSRYRGWKQRYAALYDRLHTNRGSYRSEPESKPDRPSVRARKVWRPGLEPAISAPMKV